MPKHSSPQIPESPSVRASTSSFFRTTTDSERMTLAMEDSQSFACMKELADLEEQRHGDLPEEGQPSSMRQPEGSVISSTTPTESSVFRLKLFVILLLLCLTVAGAMLVHYITTEEENDKFEYYYHVASSRLLVAMGESIDNTLAGADAMAITLATYAKQSQSTWPFVTIPNFYLRCKKYASQSNAVWTTVYHFVPAEQRDEWENYTATHNGWIDQDVAIQKTDPTYYGPLIEADQREDFNVIHGWDEYVKNNAGEEGTNRTGPFYLPNWQSAPVIPTYPIYNWDLMSTVDTSSFEPVLSNHVSVISAAYMLPDMNNQFEVDEAAITADWFRDYIGPDEDPMEPVSDVYYPVYKEMDESFVLPSHQNNHTLVAIVAESFYWRDVLKGILPEGTALDVVFENECCPTFTYRLDGGKVKYLGRGDQHERRYDDLEITAPLKELKDLSQSDYAGVPVDKNLCQFHFSIYPAPSMEERFASDNPAIFTTMTAIILSFTVVIFLLYDAKVGKRQRQTNRRLEVANEKLRHSSALQLQHFAMMSHEIRTPLNGILGMASLVEGDNLTPTQRESIKMIEGSGELLRRVVDDVLDYSKLAAGQQSIELARTSLQESLSGVLFSIQLKAESKGIKLKTVFDTLVPAFILTDGRRLQQILFNLLSNAVKFSPEKETVLLGAFVVKESKAHEQQTLRIYVEDHGKGIHSRNFERIFQPFAQATVQTERIHGGTGLGLSITKKLVEALGGSIHVESELGKFARFSIDLPLSNDDAWSLPDNIKHGTTVHMVCTNQATVEQAVTSFQKFKVGCTVHSNMESLESDDGIKVSDQRHVLLVNEKLYTDQSYKRLSSMAKKWVLVTFGPHSIVDKSVTHDHIRSLQQTIPRSLMHAISEAITKAESTSTIRSTEPSRKVTIKSHKSISIEQMRVLVAEDNLINQKVISRILQRIGIESVKVVANGQLAVDAEADEPFDVVLMDREMPVMGGLEATKLIQARPDEFSHPRAQVIFLTAHVTDDIKNECLEAGAINFLSKPCNLDDVKKCLHHVALSGGCNTCLPPPASIENLMKQEATVAA